MKVVEFNKFAQIFCPVLSDEFRHLKWPRVTQETTTLKNRYDESNLSAVRRAR